MAHSLDVATRVDYTVLRTLVGGTRDALSEVRLLTPMSYMMMGAGRKYDDFAARATELLAKLVGNTADEMTTLELTPRGGGAAPRASTRKVVSPTKVLGVVPPAPTALAQSPGRQHVPFGYERGKADDINQVEGTTHIADLSAPRRGRSPGSAPPKAKPASGRKRSSSGSRRPAAPPTPVPNLPPLRRRRSRSVEEEEKQGGSKRRSQSRSK
jgi:hypothetical protein